jgi:hypothetical protein
MVQGNNTQVRNTLRVSSSFLIEEEEEPILHDWTANAATKLITSQLWFFDTRAIIEKAIRCSSGGSIVLTNISMKAIRSALGNEFNLTTTASSF